IGNEVIHALTDLSLNELWVTIEDKYAGETGYAHYQYFHVAARDEYKLPPYIMDSGLCEGTTGDGLQYHNGMGFSTIENDYDIYVDDCAARYGGGGWWYRDCANVCLLSLWNWVLYVV
ncbi:unnamed protein product, partial [Meganyctiphanes norvegica]